MRALVWIIILFAVAVGLALLVQNFSGSAHFLVNDTLYSINIISLVIGLIVLWVVCSLLLRLIRRTIGIPSFFRRFSRKRRVNQAEYLLNETGMAFFEGRYQKAQQLAEKLLNNKEAADKLPLALILAAYSADEAGDETARNQFLERMKKLPKYNALPVHLLLGKSALLKEDLPQAKEHIQAALSINSHLTQALKLDLAYAVEMEDSETVLKHAEVLYKNGALSEAEMQRYRLMAYRWHLAQAKDAKALKRCLKKIPENLKNSVLAVDIARQYRELSLFADVVKWIKKYYPQQQDKGLLTVLNEVFPLLSERMQNKVMKDAESWFSSGNQNAFLSFSLGEMATQKSLWGKAKGFFEAGLAKENDVGAHLSLAKVLTEMDNDEAAKTHRLIALDLIEQGEKQSEDGEEVSEDVDNDTMATLPPQSAS